MNPHDQRDPIQDNSGGHLQGSGWVAVAIFLFTVGLLLAATVAIVLAVRTP